ERDRGAGLAPHRVQRTPLFADGACFRYGAAGALGFARRHAFSGCGRGLIPCGASVTAAYGCELLELFLFQPVAVPFGQLLGAATFIEADGVLVPVNDHPFHACASAVYCFLNEELEHLSAKALSSCILVHEDVFQIECWTCEK